MTNKLIRAAVIGHPIAHSKSPVIHNHWIEKYGLSGSYEAIDIAPENLPAGVQRLVGAGYAGFNVTVPHKEAIFKLCDEVDALARAVGAVNTVVIKDGKLYGTNTDVFGFVENIMQHNHGFDFGEGRSVIIGAGGAARAVLQGLLSHDCDDIYIVNRTIKTAENLADHYEGVHALGWGDLEHALSDAHLLVNTTSLGMAGQPPLQIDLDPLPTSALVNDIVYAPLMTDLLKGAHARGNETVTGIGMLLHQARPAFERWFGVLPEVDEALERLVLS